ncbi:hypothetical protein Tco_0651615 [Tanacetum coccineum]|uniref:Uncharacterized protein n=1 Tax=Tanacetum coccineum TaxID=301880 RepID=A0ABQ4WVA8_9ASTR
MDQIDTSGENKGQILRGLGMVTPNPALSLRGTGVVGVTIPPSGVGQRRYGGGDESLVAGDEGLGMRVESLSLGGDEAVSEGLQRATPVVETTVGEPLGLGYEALRRLEIALGEDRIPSVFDAGQGSGSVPEPERPESVSALRQPTLTTWIDPKNDRVYIDVSAYPPLAPPI